MLGAPYFRSTGDGRDGGNTDFLADKRSVKTSRDSDRRLAIARAQVPFAVLVGCSDSRVSPELLFDTGLGELFIVRNAGNTVDTVALGSIQYGVQVLGAPLVLVLGHERCGAVEAALSVVEKNTVYPGSIGQMIEPIIPAVLKAKSSGAAKGDALLGAAVRANVRRIVSRLRSSEEALLAAQRAGKLKIVGARYDLDDGKVDFFHGVVRAPSQVPCDRMLELVAYLSPGVRIDVASDICPNTGGCG